MTSGALEYNSALEAAAREMDALAHGMESAERFQYTAHEAHLLCTKYREAAAKIRAKKVRE